MFRYTMKSKKAKEEMTHSINVEPSDSIKRNPNKRDNDFDLGIFGTRTGELLIVKYPLKGYFMLGFPCSSAQIFWQL